MADIILLTKTYAVLSSSFMHDAKSPTHMMYNQYGIHYSSTNPDLCRFKYMLRHSHTLHCLPCIKPNSPLPGTYEICFEHS